MRKACLVDLCAVVLFALVMQTSAPAQPVFRNIFPPEEFATRQARLFEKIGNGVAILEGTTERPGEQPFRQGNQFYYLTDVAEPRAISVLDGRTKETTVFLLPANPTDVSSKYGPGALYLGEDSSRLIGVGNVLPREQFGKALEAIAKEGRIIYTPFRPEVLGNASSYDTQLLTRLNHEDPWDRRPSREEAFRLKLMGAAPRSEIRDLDPLVDELRAIKSE
jgi:Xaa-Pro aminopeptidase